MQYQQNFLPGAGSTGRGSVRTRPTTNMIPPKIEIGSPTIETPKGAYRSVKTRKMPKTPKIRPETTSPLYIPTTPDWLYR